MIHSKNRKYMPLILNLLKDKAFFKKNKTGFTLIETMIAITIIAFIFGPLFVMQGNILQRVVNESRQLQRIFFMKVFAYNAQEKIKSGSTQFNLEKREEFPPTVLRYQLAPVNQQSSLKDVPGLHMQRVVATWEDRGTKRQDMLVTFTFIKPVEKKS